MPRVITAKAVLLLALTGLSSGANASTATYTFRVPVQGLKASSAMPTNIQVGLANATLPAGTAGTAYTFDFTSLLSVSGDPTYTVGAASCTLASGTVPAGLTLASSCTLTGTPTTAVSNQNFSVRATYRGASGSGNYALTVNLAPFTFSPTLASTTTNYNVYSAAQAAGWDGMRPLLATITVPSGGVVGATSTGSYALSTGSGFPSGSVIALVNNGTIVGAGGAGGNWGTVGSAGGSALLVQFPLTVTNNGTIAGGGGGGGGSNRATVVNVLAGGAGGGGGMGYGTSPGGAADPAFAGAQYPQGGAGYNGNIVTPGLGGTGVTSGTYPNQYSAPPYASSAAGGTGGMLGQPGVAAIPGWIADGTVVPGVAGGAAGYAVVGKANVTWSTTGTVLGPQQ